MQPFIILHTNDIHGRVEGLARVATLVEQIRAENPDVPVLYFDTGDSEDASNRLSNLTKGAAMHRLLSAAGCDAAAVGNAAPQRYGPQVLRDHAAAAGYPLLLANLRMPDGALPPGVQPTTLLDLGALRLGLIGVTAEMSAYESFFDLRTPPALPLIRELATGLRREGADAVILLSHMGLATDRELAAGLQGDVTLIVGGHSHDLLPESVGLRRPRLGPAAQLRGADDSARGVRSIPGNPQPGACYIGTAGATSSFGDESMTTTDRREMQAGEPRSLSDLVPDGIFVGTSLILRQSHQAGCRAGRLLYGVRPPRAACPSLARTPGRAELVEGEPGLLLRTAWARLTDSQEALILALGDDALPFY